MSTDLVKVFCSVGHPAGDTEALSEGAGGHVDEVEAGGRVPLEVGVYLPEVEEVGGREEASLRPRGVQDWGGVAFGQDKP